MPVDIAIVGGGPSGLALAGMLERAGLDYVVYERSAKDTPPRGGCLDLHIKTGQRAMREAGCFDAFRDHGRLGEATIHSVFDHDGNKVSSWGEGRDAPEIDRTLIKECLLSTFPEHKIQWKRGISSARRDENQKIVLEFEDGTTATDFKLVVGADGVWSKIRPLITSAKPNYSGMQYWTGEIRQDNPFYPQIVKMAGHGPQVIMGRATMIWNQRQGDGHYRIDLGFIRSDDFSTKGPVKLSDVDAVRALMLQDDFFGHHTPEFKQMIMAMDNFRAWPLYYMPPELLNWSASPDVTLIGDAAHVTTPFVGDGANCAMLDAVLLSNALKQFGITTEAIEGYEQEMFKNAIDVIERSRASGYLFFDWASPAVFNECMRKRPLIGVEDE
ncbi:hypothetical protein E8E14_000945 [Neopestalotiopsis sp. 37M]|nr:hypothetical protein E8E14_000945 [Neopestalotiopsis sp. 37M]